VADRDLHPHVTSAVYNYCGSEILASYSDDDLYVFDATQSDGADSVAKFQGHRNRQTGERATVTQ